MSKTHCRYCNETFEGIYINCPKCERNLIPEEYRANRCEELGLVHAWEDIENNIVYATNPPSYPPKKRKCLNCQKVETLVIMQREIREWR